LILYLPAMVDDPASDEIVIIGCNGPPTREDVPISEHVFVEKRVFEVDVSR
jgi:hypothetical protein